MADWQLPIFDRSAWDQLSSDVGPDSVVILLASLKNEIRMGEAAMQDYLQASDMALLENQAHALKSAARTFGALRLGELCFAIEKYAKAFKESGTESSFDSQSDSMVRRTQLAALLAEFKELSEASMAVLDDINRER